jgi:SAM-dependent methyltransferase
MIERFRHNHPSIAHKYHFKHKKRTLERAKKIACFLSDSKNVLDVGCNFGLTSQIILDTISGIKVDGVELNQETLNPKLLSDDRFHLFEANICDFKIPKSYDSIIYGAVHHHIVRNAGLSGSIEVWKKLISHANKQLFFETGHISEGGRWAWQRSLQGYFRTDEEHIYYLLRTVEKRIQQFEIIGHFRIHGIKRWLIRVNLHPFKELDDTDLGHSEGREINLTDVIPYTRTFGSHQQKIIKKAECRDSPVLYYRADSQGKNLFVKKAVDCRVCLDQEYLIGKNIPYDWAVKPIFRTPDGAIVFPWVNAQRFSSLRLYSPFHRLKIAVALMDIWESSKNQKVFIPYANSLLIPTMPGSRLADVVDLNPNNFLIEQKEGGLFLRVVDFEPRSNHYRWKNRIHLSKMLLALKLKRYYPLAFGLFLGGHFQYFGFLLRYQIKPPHRRIRDRQPSLFSSLISWVRSWIGQKTVKLLPFLDEL